MNSTVRMFVAAAGVAGAVGIAAFGLDTGTAAAAPGQHEVTSSSSSDSSSSTGRGVERDESGGSTAVPSTWYPVMPHQGG